MSFTSTTIVYHKQSSSNGLYGGGRHGEQ